MPASSSLLTPEQGVRDWKNPGLPSLARALSADGPVSFDHPIRTRASLPRLAAVPGEGRDVILCLLPGELVPTQ
jgi:hypothetical protein